jgi:hypothetical protein
LAMLIVVSSVPGETTSFLLADVDECRTEVSKTFGRIGSKKMVSNRRWCLVDASTKGSSMAAFRCSCLMINKGQLLIRGGLGKIPI